MGLGHTAWWHMPTARWHHTTQHSAEHNERPREHGERTEHTAAAHTTHHSGGAKGNPPWVYAGGGSQPARPEAHLRYANSVRPLRTRTRIPLPPACAPPPPSDPVSPIVSGELHYLSPVFKLESDQAPARPPDTDGGGSPAAPAAADSDRPEEVHSAQADPHGPTELPGGGAGGAGPAALRAADAAGSGGCALSRIAGSEEAWYDMYDTLQTRLDKRPENSWTAKLADVRGEEAAEVHAINALAPFILNSRLKPLLVAQGPPLPRPCRAPATRSHVHCAETGPGPVAPAHGASAVHHRVTNVPPVSNEHSCSDRILG